MALVYLDDGSKVCTECTLVYPVSTYHCIRCMSKRTELKMALLAIPRHFAQWQTPLGWIKVTDLLEVLKEKDNEV